MVYEITPKGRESVLYTFAGGCDSASPVGDLLLNGDDTLYGTTRFGGNCGNEGGNGMVFN
jgi:hypothetical protein